MGRREGKKEEKFRLVSLFCELDYDFIGSVEVRGRNFEKLFQLKDVVIVGINFGIKVNTIYRRSC